MDTQSRPAPSPLKNIVQCLAGKFYLRLETLEAALEEFILPLHHGSIIYIKWCAVFLAEGEGIYAAYCVAAISELEHV